MDKAWFISSLELLVKRSVPKWDFHIHTSYVDGTASVEEIFKKAIEQGLEAIAFTEHTEPWRTGGPEWFDSYVREIRKFREIYKGRIEALIGVEANAISLNGDVELTGKMRESSNFVLAAVHRYPGIEGRKIRDLTSSQAIDLEFETSMGLASKKGVDAIAHIGGTCTKYCTPFPMNLTREIIRTAAKNDVAVEINPVYHKPLLDFLEMCAEEDVKLTMGSDAHSLTEIGLITEELERTFL